MLELHKKGFAVNFIGEGSAQVFFVKMEEGHSLKESFAILEEIRVAINDSVQQGEHNVLTRQSAKEFVEGVKKLNH